MENKLISCRYLFVLLIVLQLLSVSEPMENFRQNEYLQNAIYRTTRSSANEGMNRRLSSFWDNRPYKPNDEEQEDANYEDYYYEENEDDYYESDGDLATVPQGGKQRWGWEDTYKKGHKERKKVKPPNNSDLYSLDSADFQDPPHSVRIPPNAGLVRGGKYPLEMQWPTPPPVPPAWSVKGSVDYVLTPLLLLGICVPIFTVLHVVLGCLETKMGPVSRMLKTELGRSYAFNDLEDFVIKILGAIETNRY